MKPGGNTILTNKNINISTIKVIWTILLTAGVFAATLYTTQSVANAKIEFLQSEVNGLKDDFDSISISIDGIKSDQQIALADISQKLHQMELQLKELQVTLFILVDENRKKSNSVENVQNARPTS
jgi:outer membrane murein-binding lipoprotein Lpp